MPLFRSEISVIVRTLLDPASVMPAIRKVVYGSGSDQPVYNVRTMDSLVSGSMAPQRLPMILLVAFAILALLLATVGIYGVISYSMPQRVQEVGIRMALGAARADVLQMLVGQGLRLTLAGLAIGAGGGPGAHPNADEFLALALRSRRERSGNVCGRLSVTAGRGPRGLLYSGSARGAPRSNDCAAE